MLIYKQLEHGRSMYLYYPPIPIRTPFKRSSLIVLRDGGDEASAQSLLETWHLEKIALKWEMVIAFPNPTESGWNYRQDSNQSNDIGMIENAENEISSPNNEPLRFTPNGIPYVSSMLSHWSLCGDVRYIIGTGSGMLMALRIAANKPMMAAAMLLDGAKDQEDNHRIQSFAEELCRNNFLRTTMPVHLTKSMSTGVNKWFARSNGQIPTKGTETEHITPEVVEEAVSNLFMKYRRTLTGPELVGETEPRLNLDQWRMEFHSGEILEGDTSEKRHTWFVYIPQALREALKVGMKSNRDYLGKPRWQCAKVPLMIFFHGGSGTPIEAADCCKFHEIAEHENFIVVYPLGTNGCSWNVEMDEDGENDMEFTRLLILYMGAHYPVDLSRVYLSGFSAGAGQAFAFAMVHPEMIAAICPIDSNWPGPRKGPSDIDVRKIRPFAEGIRKMQEGDYRMPIWYTYGDHELSCPVYRRCSQQHMYDYWKYINHIEIKPTPEQGKTGNFLCGVKGDQTEIIKGVSKRHPSNWYEVQRFWSTDAHPLNLYNYVLMHNKGHECAEMDSQLGWNYVKQFARTEEGKLKVLNS